MSLSSCRYFSDDYYYVATIPYASFFYNVLYVLGNITLTGLSPLSEYSVRVVPYFVQARGAYSGRLIFRTLVSPQVSYWEPIVGRRSSLAGIGRGFTDPVLNKPNLDLGVETMSRRISHNDLRYAGACRTGDDIWMSLLVIPYPTNSTCIANQHTYHRLYSRR